LHMTLRYLWWAEAHNLRNYVLELSKPSIGSVRRWTLKVDVWERGLLCNSLRYLFQDTASTVVRLHPNEIAKVDMYSDMALPMSRLR
jgi:hypothetical protein